MIYDLHCHSTASDGSLTPTQLVELAKTSGVECLALTDHDGVDGIDEARAAAKNNAIHFIPGIEISVSYNRKTVHIVGLQLNTSYKPLCDGIAKLQNYRLWRAEEISKRLEKVGIKGALPGAWEFANGNMIGRMHFAHFLIKNGYAKDTRAVFKKYLVKNKPGHIHGEWASLEEAVAWITGSGGIAVIAHPARYNLKRTGLRKLITEFKQLGGQGIEVVSASHSINDMNTMAQHAKDFELYASVGSDFHDPDVTWNKMGRLPALPEICDPIWEAFTR